MPRKMRQPGEKPTAITLDTAQFPLRCSGNGAPMEARAQSPNCQITIPAGKACWMASWKNEPHGTVHCPACKHFYFTTQKDLPF
jgi:hypothetical protein